MELSYIVWVVCALWTLFCWIEVDGQKVKCPPVSYPNGRPRMRSNGKAVNFRCRSNFIRVGAKIAVCTDSGQWSQPFPVCVGKTCPRPNTPPNLTVQELHGGGVLEFTCGVGLTRSGPEKIMCDGKKWSDVPPTCVAGTSFQCNFEQETLCGWSQDYSDEFDWAWHRGETPTSNTGPKVDHTTNSPNGSYMFIESSSPQISGQRARLLSPSYSPRDVVNLCLEFYYHMLGPDESGEVGELNVFVRPLSQSIASASSAHGIFHRSGNQGDQWHRAFVRLPNMSETFQIVFQGTKRKSWAADIAFDDVKLWDCLEGNTTDSQSSARSTTASQSGDNDDIDDEEEGGGAKQPAVMTTKATESVDSRTKDLVSVSTFAGTTPQKLSTEQPATTSNTEAPTPEITSPKRTMLVTTTPQKSSADPATIRTTTRTTITVTSSMSKSPPQPPPSSSSTTTIMSTKGLSASPTSQSTQTTTTTTTTIKQTLLTSTTTQPPLPSTTTTVTQPPPTTTTVTQPPPTKTTATQPPPTTTTQPSTPPTSRPTTPSTLASRTFTTTATASSTRTAAPPRTKGTIRTTTSTTTTSTAATTDEDIISTEATTTLIGTSTTTKPETFPVYTKTTSIKTSTNPLATITTPTTIVKLDTQMADFTTALSSSIKITKTSSSQGDNFELTTPETDVDLSTVADIDDENTWSSLADDNDLTTFFDSNASDANSPGDESVQGNNETALETATDTRDGENKGDHGNNGNNQDNFHTMDVTSSYSPLFTDIDNVENSTSEMESTDFQDNNISLSTNQTSEADKTIQTHKGTQEKSTRARKTQDSNHGEVKGKQEIKSPSNEMVPVIVGVAAAVLVSAVVIAVLAYLWARNKQRKMAKEHDDQMNIITEYAETNLTF